jgi:dihydrofolate synthase/folylpolyglutamate synthase
LPHLDRVEIKPSKGRKFWLPRPALMGRHQFDNMAAAAMAMQNLPGFKVTEEHMRIGALTARWPARMQRLYAGPLIRALPEGGELWLDGGHNPHAAAALYRTLLEIDALDDRMGLAKKPVHLIMGMLNNRDPKDYLAEMHSRISSVTAVPIPDSPNCHDPSVIVEAAQSLGLEAMAADRVTPDLLGPEGSRTLISGSLYLAGDVLKQHA